MSHAKDYRQGRMALRRMGQVPFVAAAFLGCLALASPFLAQSPSPTAAVTDWGPLAVLDDPSTTGSLDVGTGPGRIRITAQCVFLQGGGHKLTLAFRSGQVAWDAATNEVVLTDSRTGVVRLSKGDRVTLGGFGAGTLAEPTQGPPVVWLVKPDPSCPAAIFATQEVVILDDAPAPSGPLPSSIPSPTVSGQCAEDRMAEAGGESLREDLELTAEGNGWTFAQAETRYCSTEAEGRVAELVYTELPDIFVGSLIPPDPDAAPILYIKGPAPDRVREMIADEDVPIILVDEQPYNLAELEARLVRVTTALIGMGFREVTAGLDLTRAGVIPAGVLRTPGVTDDPAAILAHIPEDLRDSVELVIYDIPHHDEDDAG